MQLAFEIEHETKDQNTFLSGMGDDFDSSQNLLGKSMGRVKNLLTSGSGNRKTMCYVSFIIFAFFLFVYYVSSLFSRRNWSSIGRTRFLIPANTVTL